MFKRILFIIAGAMGVLILARGVVLVARPLFVSSDSAQLFALPSLINENITLKKQVLDLQSELYATRESFVLPSAERYKEASVFSLYPFHTKILLYITLGGQDGAYVGDAVTFSKTALIGQITRVKAHQSEVTTLFDPNFSLPVRIGNNEVEGLLQGGVNPTIHLIDKTKNIERGDQVVAAWKEIPYGLLVGHISGVSGDESGAFLQATMTLPYSLNDIRHVFIISSDEKR
jgi:cell shape-determining protein MreC